MALEGTVKLPGFGPVKKKTAAEAGVGAFVLVVAIYWYRQRQAANAAASSATPASSATAGMITDPAGNQCLASDLDPSTGYCSGSAEDVQAQAASGAYDTSQLGDGLSGYYYGAGGSTATSAPGPGNFADNAEWAQYVLSYLTASAGADSGAVSTAIGLYLTGAQVTTDQTAIIDEAIAYGGTPPQAGPNGDPPGINTTAGSTGTGSSSAGSTSSTTTPPPASTTPPSSSSGSGKAAAGAISNLQSSAVTKSSFTARWNPASGATQGYAYVLSELNGTVVHKNTTKSTSISFTGLHPGWTYNLGVQGLPGGPGDNIHVPLPSK